MVVLQVSTAAHQFEHEHEADSEHGVEVCQVCIAKSQSDDTPAVGASIFEFTITPLTAVESTVATSIPTRFEAPYSTRGPPVS